MHRVDQQWFETGGRCSLTLLTASVSNDAAQRGGALPIATTAVQMLHRGIGQEQQGALTLPGIGAGLGRRLYVAINAKI